jgi:hypothetical protein
MWLALSLAAWVTRRREEATETIEEAAVETP